MSTLLLMLVGGIIVGYLSSVLILHWAIRTSSMGILLWYFSPLDGYVININKVVKEQK